MKIRTTLIGLLLLIITLACVCTSTEPPLPTRPNPTNTTKPLPSITQTEMPTAPPELPTATDRPPSPTPTVTSLPTDTPRPTETPIPPAGLLTLEKDLVAIGPTTSNLQRLIDFAPFFNGDFVRITNRGQAVMEINNEMWLRLFNNTDLEVVSVEAAGDTPLDIQFALSEGGFTGQFTAENGQVQFETPNGDTITITGTSFFVTYNPFTEETTVANFGGSIRVNSFELPSGFWLRSLSGNVEPLDSSITFEEFDALMQQSNSPLQAGETLCPDFTSLNLSATTVDGGFDLDWTGRGGCSPYSGTLTATYAGENEPYATYPITTLSGTIFDDPPTRCEGTFLILYEIRLTDDFGQEITAETSQEVFYLC